MNKWCFHLSSIDLTAFVHTAMTLRLLHTVTSQSVSISINRGRSSIRNQKAKFKIIHISKTKTPSIHWKMLLVIITGDESVNENRNKSLSARKSKKCWHLYKALTHLHSTIDPINAKTKRKRNDIKQLPLKVFREWPEIRHTFSLNEKQNFVHGSWIYWRQFMNILCSLYFIRKPFHFHWRSFFLLPNSELKCWNIFAMSRVFMHYIFFSSLVLLLFHLLYIVQCTKQNLFV